jgi:hypothetical protein
MPCCQASLEKPGTEKKYKKTGKGLDRQVGIVY